MLCKPLFSRCKPEQSRNKIIICEIFWLSYFSDSSHVDNTEFQFENELKIRGEES